MPDLSPPPTETTALRLQSALVLLLLVLAPAVPAQTPAGDAARFDLLLAQTDRQIQYEITSKQYDAMLEALRDALPPGDRLRDAQLRSVYCFHSTLINSPPDGLRYSEGALKAAREVGDRPAVVRALLCRSSHVQYVLASKSGMPDLDAAVELARELGKPQILAEALHTRGSLNSALGNQAAAMIDFQGARAAYRQAGYATEIPTLQQEIAVSYRRMGDFARALPTFEQSSRVAKAKGDWENWCYSQLQIGFLLTESGQFAQAEEVLRGVGEEAGKHADTSLLNAARMAMADAMIAQGKAADGLKVLDLADAGYVRMGDSSNNDMLAYTRGFGLARLGRHAEALEQYAKAERLMVEDGNLRYLLWLYRERTNSLEALGRHREALAESRRYFDTMLSLQRKMRVEQTALLEYEYQIQSKEFENKRLRQDQAVQQREVQAMRVARRWQWLAFALGGLLACTLGVLGWQQLRKSRALARMAMVDPLTGVASRLSIEGTGKRALVDAHRSGDPIALLLLDVDHFKSINDTWGHQAGDRVLQRIAQACQHALRDHDGFGRYGGEEFLVVCPGTGLHEAEAVAQRLLTTLAALEFDDIAPGLRTSASIGVAQGRRHDDWDALMRRADAALYRAKENGRARFETEHAEPA